MVLEANVAAPLEPFYARLIDTPPLPRRAMAVARAPPPPPYPPGGPPGTVRRRVRDGLASAVGPRLREWLARRARRGAGGGGSRCRANGGRGFAPHPSAIARWRCGSSHTSNNIVAVQ